MEAGMTKLFNMAITSGDSYYKNKKYDKAFKEVSRASLLINNPTEQPDYLWKLRIINEKYATICFNETKPKYDFFLIYYLVSFALDIARDLTAFPHIYPFYYRKEIQWSLDNGDDEDDDINFSLKQLNILKHKKVIFHEYNNFIYNELPVIYGIPIKYNEDSVRRIFDSSATNRDEYLDLMDFSEELKKKDISIIQYKCHDFVSKLLQEYYDMENQ